MKKFFIIFGFVLILTVWINNSHAQTPPMYATCDACGHCAGPGVTPTTATNWANCVKCMYPTQYPPSSVPNPADNKTLEVDPTTNRPPKPADGRAYTLIGCVKTDIGSSFMNEGAAQSLVVVILGLIFKAVGAVALVYLIYGSFLIITSQANMERLSKGKSIILGAIIGLIFSLSSVFLIKVVASGILRIPGIS